ncbi:hypothetical protein K413DRAFT_3177 [Clostridium sp. ASBs410]|nr:hypothetical protein K413DRAFT_3177 [Clostridium sp. ASBs410]
MDKEFARVFYDGMPWCRCRKAYISKRIAIDGLGRGFNADNKIRMQSPL